MVGRLSGRARVGRVLIAVAVLVPAALIAGIIVLSSAFGFDRHVHSLFPWIVTDAALLGVGFLLNRGEAL